MCPAAAPAALSPCASVAPAASAAAFFAAPASSTPTGSSDCSQTTPARMNSSASVAASGSSADAATSPAPSLTISCACAGPPMTAMRADPNSECSSALGAAPSGGTRPLASETIAARGGRSLATSELITSSSPREGTPRNTSSARARLPPACSMRRSRGSSTPGRYRRFSPASARSSAWSAVRVCSVVRSPARARSTATAVPNDPAPMTTARRPPGTGKGRLERRSAIAARTVQGSKFGPWRPTSRVMTAIPASVRDPAAARWVASGCAPTAGRAARDALDGASDPALLIAFASGSAGLDAAAAELAAAAPGVPAIGLATPSALPGLPARESRVAVAALAGSRLAVAATVVSTAAGLREAGAEAAACLGDVAGRAHQALVLLVDVRQGDPQDVVRGAYSVAGAGVPLVGGGGVADAPGGPMLLHGAEAHDGAVVAAAIGSDAPLGVGVRHGLRAAGEPLLVTRTDGLRVLELDGRPALDAYLDRLGCTADDEDTLHALARRHPLGVSRRAGEEQVRTVVGVDLAERALTVLGQLPQGGLAWLMSGDCAAKQAAAQDACADALAALRGAAPTGILAFEPLARRASSGDSAGCIREVAGVPVAGGTTIGQIARTRGLVGFHNQAHAVLALA